jgi:hypothetical protein
MRPSRYFAIASWTLLEATWIAALAMQGRSDVTGGMAISTAVAVCLGYLTRRRT